MFRKKLKIVLIFFLNYLFVCASAQQAVLCSGKDAAGVGGSVSYSIGQIDYNYIVGFGGTVNEGVQQPFIASTLPITEFLFSATKMENSVILKWQTSTEKNCSKFILERSNNGVVFSAFTEVLASGNSTLLKNYSSIDLKPLEGSNFYRVKAIDVDGKFLYSKVVLVKFDPDEIVAIVYPNPVRDKINLKISSLNIEDLSYVIYGQKGDLIRKNYITKNLTSIDTRLLPIGTYYLKLLKANFQITTIKIIKVQ